MFRPASLDAIDALFLSFRRLHYERDAAIFDMLTASMLFLLPPRSDTIAAFRSTSRPTTQRLLVLMPPPAHPL